ncbi:MAG: lytic transglycosylase domain-containing protein [Thermaurantiacus sp.]
MTRGPGSCWLLAMMVLSAFCGLPEHSTANEAPRGLPRVELPRGLTATPGATPPGVQALPVAPPRRAPPTPTPTGPPSPDDWTRCRPAILAAEAEFGIPPFLLLAIGRVETGRRSPATGRIEPWPWAVNVDGTGYYLNSRDEAVAFIGAAGRSGARSMDIGCMQVSLLHHPNAFATLSDGFDPVMNARYAARFLADLRTRLGGWLPAIGAYHSATEWRAEPYRARVLANWAAEGGNAALLGAAQAAVSGDIGRSLSRWFAMQVVTPTAATAAGAASPAEASERGIRVVVPSR